MSIGNLLMSSSGFPPTHTVHAAFTAHGVPSRIVVFGKLLSGYVSVFNFLCSIFYPFSFTLCLYYAYTRLDMRYRAPLVLLHIPHSSYHLRIVHKMHQRMLALQRLLKVLIITSFSFLKCIHLTYLVI